MKKFLLTLVALFSLGFAASAETVTFDFVGDGTSNLYGMTRLSGTTQEYNADPTTVKDGAVSITLTGNTRLWKDGVRFYKGSAMEISASGYVVTGVTFGNNNYSKFNYGTSALSSKSWTGNAESVKLTCNITSKNTPVNTLTITIEKVGNPDKADAGLAFSQSNVTCVKGDEFVAPELTQATDAEVVFSSSKEEVATVDAATGEVTIVGAGTTTITATAAETDAFNAGSASYTLTVKDVATRITQLPTKENAIAVVKFALTVVYVNGQNVYVVDEYGDATLLYGKNEFKGGDKIPAGWEATYSPFNGLPEYKGEFPAASGTAEYSYAEVDNVTDADINRVVVLRNVSFAEATPVYDANNKTKTNFTGVTADNTELTFRTNWNVPSVPAGYYNVTCAVATYNGNLQLYPISYEGSEIIDIELTKDVANWGKSSSVHYKFYVNNHFGADSKYEVNLIVEHADSTITAAGVHSLSDATTKAPAMRVPAADFTHVFTGKAHVDLPVSDTEYKAKLVLSHNGVVKQVENITLKPDSTVGIEDVVSDENAAAEYYNLQGVRVAQPEAGRIYIVRRGSKVTKELLK